MTGDIIHGDCLDVMAKMAPESVDLIVTSPPYNMHAGGTGWARGQHRNHKFTNYDTHDDAMPRADYVAWQRACLDSMMRVLASDGAILYNQKWRIENQLLLDASDIVKGFPVRQVIIWAKSGGINHDQRWFLPTYEVIYLIAKPEFKLRRRANHVGDVWKFQPERKNLGHPTPFPLELPLRCIASTDAKVILDPFCGSGTTCLAAKQLNRKYVGIDISEQYCGIARRRINESP